MGVFAFYIFLQMNFLLPFFLHTPITRNKNKVRTISLYNPMRRKERHPIKTINDGDKVEFTLRSLAAWIPKQYTHPKF